MALLHYLLSALEDAVMAFDVSRKEYLFISPAIEKITGYTQEQFEKQPDLWNRLTDPLDADEVTQKVGQMATPGELVLTHRIKDAGSRLKWVQVKVVNIISHDDGGQLTMHIVKDITDIVLHREEAEKKITFLNSVINAGIALLFRIDSKFNYTFVNDTYTRDFGYQREELIGRNIEEVCHPDDVAYLKGALQEVISNPGKVIHITHRKLDAAGKPHWVESDVVAVQNNQGETTEIQGVGLDVTHQVAMQGEVLQTKINLEALINNTDDHIWSVDREKRIIFANQAYLRWVKNIFGIDVHPGMQLHERIEQSARHYEQWEEYYRAAFNGRQFRIYNEFINPQTHESTVFEVGFNPIYNNSGEVTGTVCVARDVTQMLVAESEIKEQNKKLRDIASLSSHELRGPVAAIIGLVGLLETADITNPEKQPIIDHLKLTSKKLDDVIHHIVDRTFTLKNNAG